MGNETFFFLFFFRLPLFWFFLSPHFLSSYPYLLVHFFNMNFSKYSACISCYTNASVLDSSGYASRFSTLTFRFRLFLSLFIRLHCLVMRQAWYINCCYCCRWCCRFCSVASSISWTWVHATFNGTLTHADITFRSICDFALLCFMSMCVCVTRTRMTFLQLHGVAVSDALYCASTLLSRQTSYTTYSFNKKGAHRKSHQMPWYLSAYTERRE